MAEPPAYLGILSWNVSQSQHGSPVGQGLIANNRSHGVGHIRTLRMSGNCAGVKQRAGARGRRWRGVGERGASFPRLRDCPLRAPQVKGWGA